MQCDTLHTVRLENITHYKFLPSGGTGAPTKQMSWDVQDLNFSPARRTLLFEDEDIVDAKTESHTVDDLARDSSNNRFSHPATSTPETKIQQSPPKAVPAAQPVPVSSCQPQPPYQHPYQPPYQAPAPTNPITIHRMTIQSLTCSGFPSWLFRDF